MLITVTDKQWQVAQYCSKLSQKRPNCLIRTTLNENLMK